MNRIAKRKFIFFYITAKDLVDECCISTNKAPVERYWCAFSLDRLSNSVSSLYQDKDRFYENQRSVNSP